MLRVSPKSIETQLLKLLALHPPHQAPLSTGFSRQEYCSGLPFPSLKDLLDSGIKPQVSCIAGKFFRVWATREAHVIYRKHLYSRNNWQTHFLHRIRCLPLFVTSIEYDKHTYETWNVPLWLLKSRLSIKLIWNYSPWSHETSVFIIICIKPQPSLQWEIHTLGAIRNWWMV